MEPVARTTPAATLRHKAPHRAISPWPWLSATSAPTKHIIGGVAEFPTKYRNASGDRGDEPRPLPKVSKHVHVVLEGAGGPERESGQVLTGQTCSGNGTSD